MSTPKPIKLKLKISRQPDTGGTASPNPTPTATTATPATPSSTAPQRRITLKHNGSKAGTPVEAAAPTLQKASPQKVKKEQRSRKPSAKVLASAKRDHSDSEGDATSAPPAKKIKRQSLKLKLRQTPTTPGGVNRVLLKHKGKPPKRPHGEGYDSEASDREQDPAIEEQFTMRFDDKLISESGADCSDDCAYIHQMIQERRIGVDAKIAMKFYHADGRRAAITVRNNHYAATLVDMPTITESMKSFDRKAWVKTADISQMLLAFARIPTPEIAKTIELPNVIDRKTYEFPHGITPPMRYARNRRFRDRTRKNDIESLEREVDALFNRDDDAEQAWFEWYDPDALSRDPSRAITEDGDEAGYVENAFEDENADAEGEVDESYDQDENMQGDGTVDLEEALAMELENQVNLEEMATPAPEAATPMIELEGSTPTAVGNESDDDSGDDDDDDDDGDEDDDDDGEEEMDEEARMRQAELAEQREDIAEMEKSLKELQNQYHNMQNPILRKRLETNIENTRTELSLKKAAFQDQDEI